MIRYGIICLLFLVISGCSKKQLGRDEFVRYVVNPDNGLLRNKSIQSKSYTALYKPAEYMTLIEGGENDSLSFNEKINRYKYSYNFTLRIKDGNKNFESEVLKSNLSSVNDYYERLRYLSFQMQDDISLIVGSDTLPCSLFHYERSFGVVPHADFSMAFERIDTTKNNEMVLVFNDNFFNNGQVLFTFNKSDLDRVPYLKL